MNPLNPSNADGLQRTLREQEVILENAGVGIGFIRERVVQRCNRRFAEIFGYADPAAMVGRSSLSLYCSLCDFEQLGRTAYPVLAQGRPYQTRLQMRRAGGEVFWCSLTGKLISPDDEEAGSIWIVEDINERVLAEKALQTALSEQALILDHAMVGIVFLRNRAVTRCNRRFEEMFGYGRGELDGTSSRNWYMTDEDWKTAGRQCYEPLSSGRSFSGEMLLRRKDGSPLWCEVRSKAVNPEDLSQGSIWIAMDLSGRKAAEAALAAANADLEAQVGRRTAELRHTVEVLHQEINERRQAEAQIRHLSLHDPLTGLPNRIFMEQLLEQALRDAAERRQQVAVLLINLDRFKHINDVFGHEEGDRVLGVVAQRMRQATGIADTITRLGADEFVVILPGVDRQTDILEFVRRLSAALRPGIRLGVRECQISCSAGISVFPDDGGTPKLLLQHADMAMRRAKDGGRASHQFFSRQLDREFQDRIELEQAMHHTLQAQGFEIHYQPQIDIASGRIAGVEALARWHRDGTGWIPPGVFIPVAEDSGMIHALGLWVLEQACRQNKAWSDSGIAPLVMAVNVSAMQLAQSGFVEQVLDILARTGMQPGQLELEITESVIMRQVDRAIRVMEQLHAAGIQLSIDDFGTGYSSLSYLRSFPLSRLKIDRSFVKDIDTNPNDEVICRTIVAMAQNLGLEVVAEGVESQTQLDRLASYGCQHYQGYHCSRPLPAREIEPLLRG